MWHVSSHSSVATLRTAIHLLLTYLHTLCTCMLFQSNTSMHHYECVALCKDISLQRGRFCARSVASCIPRSSEDRSSWMMTILSNGIPLNRIKLFWLPVTTLLSFQYRIHGKTDAMFWVEVQSEFKVVQSLLLMTTIQHYNAQLQAHNQRATIL